MNAETQTSTVSTDTPRSSVDLEAWQIECVLADRGWILERLAREISKAATSARDIEVSIVDSPSGEADLTYFLPYSVQKPQEHGLVVSYFSHQEMVEPAHSNFLEKARAADHCVVSARKYQRLLNEEGIDSVSLVYLATELAAFEPRLTIGVVGRTYHTGRKGEELVAQLMDLPFVDFVFTGEGWPEPPKYFAGEAGMQKFYQEIDYLLIPATIEGGPVPLFEALASGCEVISSDVGCVEDFPHIPFETGNADDLRRVLNSLYEKKMALRKAVESHDWSDFGAAHVTEFRALLEASGLPRKSALPEVTQSKNITDAHAMLIMHGSESTSKGGPTTRITAVAAQVAGQMNCELAYSLEGHLAKYAVGGRAQGSTVDIVHVFNSWPLSSALNELGRANSIAKHVIYSPITLNLAYLPYYAKLVPHLLRNSSVEAEAGLQRLVQDTEPLGFDAPVRLAGTPNHFQSLYAGAQQADHLVFLSEYEERLLRGLGVETPGTVVRNGVDIETMASGDPELFKRHYGVREFVLCVGRIETRKNQAALALAAKSLNVTLVLIGHVGDADYFELVKMHSGHNLLHIDRIEDRAMLASAYVGARCKVLCSWAEGAPLAVLEAGSAGTPLICSNMGAEREYCGEWASYVHPADVAGLRSTLEALVAKPESAVQRAARSASFCERYSLTQHATATAELYKTLLQNPPVAKRPSHQWLDVTHLAHTLSNNQVITGVNSLEQEIAEQLQTQTDTGIYLWNSPQDTFYSVNDAAWRDGTYSRLANLRDPLVQDGAQQFSQLEISIEGDQSTPEQPPSTVHNSGAGDARLSPLRLSKTLLKVGLNKLPGSLQNNAIAVIRRFRKDFAPEVEPQHKLIGATPEMKGGPAQPPRVAAEVSATRSFKTFSLQGSGVMVRGDRFIILGQPWISNDRYLQKLIELVDETGVQLEAMVPDILYVTRTLSFDEKTRSVYRGRLELLLSRCTRVYTISLQAAREIRDFVALLRLQIEVSVIPMGLPAMTTVSQPCPPLRDKSYLVYVSSLNSRKNHEFLLSVWREARRQLSPELREKWRLALVGTPQRGFEHYGEPQIRQRLERDEGVLMLSGIDDAQLNWIYEHSAFTVYPSVSEGWGFPVQESLAHGRVCVVSDTVPAAEETLNAALRKLAPDDYMGWVKTLSMLMQNDKQRLALQTHAETWEQQSWEGAAQVIRSNDVRH